MLETILRWFDSGIGSKTDDESPDWGRLVPFIALHLACFAVYFVGVSWIALVIAAVSYLIRIFAITGFFHRYFSHKAFRVGRTTQFVFAAIGASATQRGPLWWAAHHRAHHREPDTDVDPHNALRGFWWSHIGWFMSSTHFRTRTDLVNDWLKFPELVWLDRFDLTVPVALVVFMYLLGESLAVMGTDGWQIVVWGYVISTVVLTHSTLCVNSICHRYGRRRFETRDMSRNNWIVALLTLGEGWHNNHHRYAGSARQGFYWWELDLTYYGLVALSAIGLVKDLKGVPQTVLEEVVER